MPVIKKSKAGVQDLLLGKGRVTQERAGGVYTIDRIDVPVAVDSIEELQALEVANFTRARLYSSTTTFADYIYDEQDASGVPVEGQPGSWHCIAAQTEFEGVSDAVAAISANPASYPLKTGIKTLSYRTKVECDALSIAWPDGGGAEYVVEALGTPDGYGEHAAGGSQISLQTRNVVFPEMFGAVGDSAHDDTEALQAWLDGSNNLEGCPKTYVCKGTGLSKEFSSGLYLDGKGMKVSGEPLSNQYNMLFLQPKSAIQGVDVSIKNIALEGNNRFAKGLLLNSQATSQGELGVVTIENVSAKNLDNAALSTAVSTVGISINHPARSLVVENSEVVNVTRTQVNSGYINSAGIGLTNVTGQVDIRGNKVRNITSPSGDADADGIYVFSENRLVMPPEKQKTSVKIRNNHITQCKGRFVKTQCANVSTHENYFENWNMSENIVNFTGVDSQVGGSVVRDNFFRLWMPNGAGSACLCSGQSHEYGGEELVHRFTNNTAIVKGGLPYGFQVLIGDNTNTTAIIEGNLVRREEVSDSLSFVSNFVWLDMPASAEKVEIKISGNMANSLSGKLIGLAGTTGARWSDDTTGPIIKGFTSLAVLNNQNTYPDADSDLWLSNFPIYIQDLVVAGNSGYSRAQVYAKGLDATLLAEGNSFYYGTDGTALGGLVGVPSTHARYVSLERGANNSLVLKSHDGSSMLVGNTSGTFYSYSGTAV